MAKVTVYQAKAHDFVNDDSRSSQLYWTREGAKVSNLTIDESSAVEVDEADLGDDGFSIALDDISRNVT